MINSKQAYYNRKKVILSNKKKQMQKLSKIYIFLDKFYFTYELKVVQKVLYLFFSGRRIFSGRRKRKMMKMV